jgi:hypothetical protein
MARASFRQLFMVQPSVSYTDVDGQFRDSLFRSYGFSPDDIRDLTTFQCSLLGVPVPIHHCIASHCFQRKWRIHSDLVAIDDVNSPQNGLFLYRPIEYCFDNGFLIFVFSPSENAFICRLLRKSMWDEPVLKEGTIIYSHSQRLYY